MRNRSGAGRSRRKGQGCPSGPRRHSPGRPVRCRRRHLRGFGLPRRQERGGVGHRDGRAGWQRIGVSVLAVPEALRIAVTGVPVGTSRIVPLVRREVSVGRPAGGIGLRGRRIRDRQQQEDTDPGVAHTSPLGGKSRCRKRREAFHLRYRPRKVRKCSKFVDLGICRAIPTTCPEKGKSSTTDLMRSCKSRPCFN